MLSTFFFGNSIYKKIIVMWPLLYNIVTVTSAVFTELVYWVEGNPKAALLKVNRLTSVNYLYASVFLLMIYCVIAKLVAVEPRTAGEWFRSKL